MSKERERFDNVTELVQYYLSLYYDMVNDKPEIKGSLHRHVHFIEQIDGRYKKMLKKLTQFDYADNEQSFAKRVELLTQATKKLTDHQSKQRRVNKIKDGVFMPKRLVE